VRIDVDLALVNRRPYATPLRPSNSEISREPVVVMHLSGALVQGSGVSFFLEQLRMLIARGIKRFVVDLLQADFVDARGVGGLAAAYNSVRDARGRIKYVLDSQELLSSICRNHLDRVFEIYHDETSALAGF
jgi:anti-anti-sigma regulatory factor